MFLRPLGRPLAFFLGLCALIVALTPPAEAGQNDRPAYSVGRNGAKLKWLPARPSRPAVLTRLAQYTTPADEDKRSAVRGLGNAPDGTEPSSPAAGTQNGTRMLPGGTDDRYRLPPPTGLNPSNGLGPSPAYRSQDATPPATPPTFDRFRSPGASPVPKTTPQTPAPPTVPLDRGIEAPPAAATENVLEIERQEEGSLTLPAPGLQRPRALEQDTWKDDVRQGKPLESPLDTMERGQDLSGAKDDCKPPRDVPIDEILDMLPPPKGSGAKGNIFPPNCPMDHETYQPRQWADLTYTWKASGLCHKPLYFEDVQLERYGHSWGPYLQPIISGGHFFLNVPILPYKMGLEPPCECMYTLGYYRPGSCAPYMLDPIPLSVRAALFEAGAWTGMSYVIP